MGLLHVPWTPIQLPHLGRRCSPWLGSLCSLVLIWVPPFFSTISCLASSMKPSLVAPHQITRCSQPNRLKKKGESSRSSQYLPSVFSPKVLSKSSSSRLPLQINLYFLSPRNFLQELKTFLLVQILDGPQNSQRNPPWSLLWEYTLIHPFSPVPPTNWLF